MRRGHLGSGGWRIENPRLFRPRNPGIPHFRPTRPYHQNLNRFPPLGPRLHRLPHFENFNEHYNNDHYDRNPYRGHNSPVQNPGLKHRKRGHFHDRGGGQRQILPYLQQTRPAENKISDVKYFDNNKSQSYHINSMGDVDHRLGANNSHSQEGYSNLSPWADSRFDPKPYQNKSPQKPYMRNNENFDNRNTQINYPGHRPPASDHYSTTPDIENTNNDVSFSRSIDDTVDIVRKRLLNRNEQQSPSSDLNENHLNTGSTSSSQYEGSQQEPQPRRRIQRQRQIVKSDCDKMKTNIVQQLFKMDKDKIHKLMDNPNSSTKFEYAINSLITESQNSLNRHLRSLAEKSLSSSSDEFIHNDNNTIYEDTFMKQMQCVLDPQDTVLLEDIKPLVLAELSKILQLSDVEQMYEIAESHDELCSTEHVDYDYRNENLYYDEYAHENYLNQDEIDTYNKFNRGEGSNSDELEDVKHSYDNHTTEIQLYRRRSTETCKSTENKYDDIKQQVSPDLKPIFETFKDQSDEISQFKEHERNHSFDSDRSQRDICRQRDSELRKSTENRRSEDNPSETKPLFETNRDQTSEDEDPFDELDRQYHVPVDHTFLDNEDCTQSSTPSVKTINNFISVKTEKTLFDDQFVQDKNESIRDTRISQFDNTPSNDSKLKDKNSNECATRRKSLNSSDSSFFEVKKEKEKERKDSEPTIVEKRNSEKDIPSEKSSISSSSRKRSIDQRPSHRKEKRKKSDSGSDVGSLNKSKTIDVSKNSTLKKIENPENTKLLFNLFLPKNDNNKQVSKTSKPLETQDKEYSNKYVKRKENVKKDKHTTPTKKHNHTSHSTICKDNYTSPRDNDTATHQNPAKTDAKAKLKTIDMFMEQPKKTINVYQSHRNTAPHDKNNIVQKKSPFKPITLDKDTTKKLISKETQTSNKSIYTTRFSQTDRKKFVTKSVQTDPMFPQKETTKSTDVFERMKEIDLEIQVLLQEKFKLYNSFESNKTCPVSEQTLGMAVLNVVPVNKIDEVESCDSIEGSLAEDTIVEDFTSIPVEELEEIALETVEETESTGKRRTRRHSQKIAEEDMVSLSPSVKRSSRRGKPLNISLLEQIITDDRPLEDIIVLDELENTPGKKTGKKKSQKGQTKNKKTAKKSKPNTSNQNRTSTPQNVLEHNMKECSVVLKVIDVSRYLEIFGEETSENVESIVDPISPKCIIIEDNQELPTETLEEQTDVIEETVVNDIHFDMLDVSEDIVIGDNCEIKCRDSDRLDVPINEEIILDNSQSSCDVMVPESSQSEPECKTYDYSTDENLRRDAITVTGNADAVLAIECIENNFIAACLDGNVYHFNCDGQLLNTLRGSNLAVTCITIVKEKYGITVYTGSLDSRIRYYDLETGVEKGPECNVLSPIQTMDRAWDTIFVGTRTGFVLQFECKNNMLIPVSTVKFSDQSILALRAMKEGPRKVLLVAARSENVTIKDAQTGLLLRSLVGPIMTVYTLLFEDGKVYCGTSSHQIHVFDYTSGSHVGSHEGGKGAVCLRATGGLVFAGCYDGCVYVYREGETRPLAQLRGPSLMLLSLAIVGSKIIAGYKDRGLYIWKIPLNILKEMIL